MLKFEEGKEFEFIDLLRKEKERFSEGVSSTKAGYQSEKRWKCYAKRGGKGSRRREERRGTKEKNVCH